MSAGDCWRTHSFKRYSANCSHSPHHNSNNMFHWFGNSMMEMSRGSLAYSPVNWNSFPNGHYILIKGQPLGYGHQYITYQLIECYSLMTGPHESSLQRSVKRTSFNYGVIFIARSVMIYSEAVNIPESLLIPITFFLKCNCAHFCSYLTLIERRHHINCSPSFNKKHL